jgi:hypothetical protein
MSGMQWILAQKIIVLVVKWLIVAVLLVFAYLSFVDARKAKTNVDTYVNSGFTVNKLLGIAIFNPFQLTAWAIWGSYFVEKSWFVWTSTSIFIFSIGASIGVFIILKTYA